MNPVAPQIRFREARERLGLSPDEVAAQRGGSMSAAGVWDIEMCEGDLTSCYSPRDVQKLCRILGIRPDELFGEKITESPISADELAQRILDECHLRCLTIEQFEDLVGWRLSACIDPPAKLLEDMTCDGLQWLCRELQIDWRRVL